MKRILFPLCLLLSLSSFAQSSFTYLASFDKVALYGFADSAGNTKTIGLYNLIMKPKEGFSVVWAGQQSSNDYDNIRYGFTKADGTVLVTPKYSKAESFSEGMAVVRKAGGFMAEKPYGFIDTRGKEAIPLQYKYAHSFSQGLAAVAMEEKKWYFIDKSGATKIEGPFLDADDFSEGMAGVSVEYDMGSGVKSFRKGYIDRTGKMVVKPEYNYTEPFRKGVAVVHILEYPKSGPSKSYVALIDKMGRRLTDKEYISISNYASEEFLTAKVSGSGSMNSETDKYVMLDRNGNEVPGSPVLTGSVRALQAFQRTGRPALLTVAVKQ